MHHIGGKRAFRKEVLDEGNEQQDRVVGPFLMRGFYFGSLAVSGALLDGSGHCSRFIHSLVIFDMNPAEK